MSKPLSFGYIKSRIGIESNSCKYVPTRIMSRYTNI